MAQTGSTPTISALTRVTTEALRTLLAGEPHPDRLTAALRHLAKWRAELIGNTIAQNSGKTVLSGPFAGMSYAVRAAEGSRAARLLGCYEASLAPVIEAIIARGYDLIMDLGAAEGYYAVGLARRLPEAQVIACDENPAAQALCRDLAQANGVADRVLVRGRVGHADFDCCADQRTVVICDIEGAEDALLDPRQAPGLRAADILVEVHDCLQPGLSGRIAERFAATHRITRIDRQIDAANLPGWMETLSDLDRLLALWEWRNGPTPWLWMERT